MASGQLHRNVPPLGRLRSIRMILHGAGLLHGIMYNNVKFNLIAYSSLLKEKKPGFLFGRLQFSVIPSHIFSISQDSLSYVPVFLETHFDWLQSDHSEANHFGHGPLSQGTSVSGFSTAASKHI